MCQSKWLQIMIWLRLWIPMMSGFQVGREYDKGIFQEQNLLVIWLQKFAKKLMAKAGITGEELDFIILATITPDSMMPSTAARVQANIGANKAFAFDLTAACSGFVFALSTAEKFIASGRFQKGLVIGSETLSKAVDWSDRSTAVLFGDGAGGVLLEASEQEHFMAESLNSDGSRSECLTYGHSGLHSPFSDQENADSFLKNGWARGL